MANALFPTESWLRAMTLEERAAARRARAGSASGFDAALAAREIAAWRAHSPFDDPAWLARCLQQHGVSETEFERILGEEARVEETSAKPDWVADIERAYAEPRERRAWTIALAAPNDAGQTLRFIEALEPLLRRGRDRLHESAREILRRHPDAPFDADRCVSILIAPLPWTLHAMVLRSMVLELNVLRMQGQLEGSTKEARFEAFVQRISSADGALRFLAEYPVLARLIHASIDRWARASAEFLQHLALDWRAIQRTFGPTFSGEGIRLAKIDGGAGDAHRDGRSVLVAHFEGGARLVYKPRSMAVDVHFQELLAWIDRSAVLPPLRKLTVLDRGDHGWVEFVAAAPCTQREEVQRFYRRQGGLIALLYALEAIDFHFENLIASGEHPVLIDLESLFHARLGEATDGDPSLRLVGDATARSVLRIGILPQKVMGSDEHVGVDLSGLGGAEGQMTPERVLQWSDVATDTMHARRERVAMPGSNNLPRLASGGAEVIHFEQELKEGFAAVYRLLARERDTLLASDGLLARFSKDTVRCVLRPTQAYASILSEALHPDNLRDGLERARFLDRIWTGVDSAPHLAHVVGFERADMERMDVPVFTTRPGSRALWSSREECLPDLLEVSGLELVARRLHAMDDADLERQLWFVHASLATLEISRATLDWTTYPRVTIAAQPDPDEVRARLVAAARRVGDRLISLALRDGRDVAWMGLQYDDRSWSMVPLLEDLYSGAAGVIHFLAYLGDITGEARYVEIARAALATYRRRLEFSADLVRAVGAFNGWGGAIWVLSHWSRLWNEPELARLAHAIVERAARVLDEDEHLDVIGGSAGLIGALVALQRVAPDERVVELARRAGERLVQRATRLPHGVGWFTRIDTELPITGFSHGAAGISWALCELFTLTGDERLRELALQGVMYERSRLVAGEGNWMEISKEKLAVPVEERGDATLSIAWCYGAPGVGLARLRSLPVLAHPFVREDVEIALRTTLARGFGRNHSLCHGDLGNLDFVLQAADVLDDANLRARALEIEATILASIDASGFLCGVPLGVESPSLMNGLAGIGYGLLRAAHPARVPSVLVLEAPRVDA